MNKLIAYAQKQKTETLLDAIRIIGGGNVSEDVRMARAAMIEVIAERMGDEAADNLMDELGL